MSLLNVVKLLEGKDGKAKRDVITSLLKRDSVKFLREPYEGPMYRGENIIVHIPGRLPSLVLTCHYDTVPGSPGANDDSSAVAVLLELSRRLAAKKHVRPKKNALTIAFFDEEEKFCRGARHYVSLHGVEDVGEVVSLELVGRGDVIALWPVTEKNSDMQAISSVKNTALKRRWNVHEEPKVWMFYSDELAFRQAGIKKTVILTLAPSREKEEMLRFVRTPRSSMSVKLLFGMLKLPHFFKLYHSAEDTSSTLNESSLKMALELVESMVRDWEIGSDKK